MIRVSTMSVRGREIQAFSPSSARHVAQRRRCGLEMRDQFSPVSSPLRPYVSASSPKPYRALSRRISSKYSERAASRTTYKRIASTLEYMGMTPSSPLVSPENIRAIFGFFSFSATSEKYAGASLNQLSDSGSFASEIRASGCRFFPAFRGGRKCIYTAPLSTRTTMAKSKLHREQVRM